MKYILNNLQKLWLKEIGISDNFLKISNKSKIFGNFDSYQNINNKYLINSDKNENIVNKELIQYKLNALKENINNCNKCELHKYRQNIVFGEGIIHNPEVFIIGEAPGENEDRIGLPFVGKSGKLLDAILYTIGLSRDKNVFISNIIKCRPPCNRNPKIDEIKFCINYIHEQIKIMEPKKILTLGRFAANSILNNNETISNLRGKIYNYQLSKSSFIPLIVTFHPSYLLRSPEEKVLTLLDIMLLHNIDK